MCRCLDEEMRKEMFRLSEPSLEQAVEFIDAWEVGSTSNKMVKSASNVIARAAQAKTTRNHPKRSFGGSQQNKKNWGATIEEVIANKKKAVDGGACLSCCSQKHRRSDFKFADKPCQKCNKAGHPHYLCYTYVRGYYLVVVADKQTMALKRHRKLTNPKLPPQLKLQMKKIMRRQPPHLSHGWH